ncbi:MAG: sugar phosphate isomerase/epimerase family protein [Planctomycetota bacterium]|jgi:sugar phosphate isomerase/epimerase
MDLSITTDYTEGTGDPSPYLKHIAEAGFTHIHWCHHWHTDFVYTEPEIAQIDAWLKEYGLKLLDLHATSGQEKNWTSQREYERQAGVELVRNRIDMTARLGGNVIIMHVPIEPGHEQLRRSLDELRPYAMERGVRIAAENGKLEAIQSVLADYEPEYVGLCYDAGHGNLGYMDLDSLDTLKDRLISIHLHDNDGEGDHHRLLFTGTVDWDRLAGIIAASSYDKCISMEVARSKSDDEMEFLKQAYDTGTRFTNMVAAAGS